MAFGSSNPLQQLSSPFSGSSSLNSNSFGGFNPGYASSGSSASPYDQMGSDPTSATGSADDSGDAEQVGEQEQVQQMQQELQQQEQVQQQELQQMQQMQQMMMQLMQMLMSSMGGVGGGAASGGAGGYSSPVSGASPYSSGASSAPVSNGTTASSNTGSAPSSQPTGNVASWIQQAQKILEAQGVPASKLSAQDLNIIIQHESSGNPNAQNNSDSNAAAGDPSKGLMQTISTTFNSYALKGYNNIWNPVDNIIAGTRYALSRYGSLDNVPGVKAVKAGGSYVGY